MLNFTVFDNLLDGVLVTDQTGVIIYTNETLSSIVELKHRHMQNRSVTQAFQALPSLANYINKSLLSDETTPYSEMHIETASQGSKYLQVSVQKQASYFIAFVRDVSLEATLHTKYRDELNAKEDLINRLDRKVFELEFLLSNSPLSSGSSQQAFSLDTVFYKVCSSLGCDAIGIFENKSTLSGQFDFKVESKFLSNSNGDISVSEKALSSFFSELNNPLTQKFLGENKSMILEQSSWIAVACGALQSNQEFKVFLYVFSTNHRNSALTNAHLLETFSQQTALIMENQQLFHETITDAKTQIYNNRYLQHKLDQEISRASRYNRPFSILVFDIDHFKKLNDTHGHLAGDIALKRIAQTLKDCFRTTDTVARFGGEEFVVLCIETTRDNMRVMADRARQRIEQTMIDIGDNKIINVTVSGGIASFPEDGETADKLFAAADEALYVSKKSGRNQISLAHALPKAS